MPQASIIVPIYNVEKYLPRCLESILSQTFEDFELILVTDGCTDGCCDICDEYSARDSRIKVFHNEHGGVSKARNTGIQNAVGQYIFFVDSDDYILPDYLKQLMNKSGDLVCQPYEVVDEYDNTVYREHFVPKAFDNSKDAVRQLLVDGIIGGACLKRFRLDIVKQNGILFPENTDFGEDTCFSLQYAVFCKTVCIDDTANYRYVKYSNRNTLSNECSFDRIMAKKKANRIMSRIVFPENDFEEQKLFLELFEDTCKKRINACVYGRNVGFWNGWKALCKLSNDSDFTDVIQQSHDAILPERVRIALCSHSRFKLFYEHMRRFVAVKYYRLESKLKS